MIGWAIKRGFQGATGASGTPPQEAEDADTTQLEAPDTPAPVFAARAVRHAIFGTPVPAMRRTATPAENASRTRSPMKSPSKSPSKPPGILLTPGTATSRRKRVSFGHEVKAKHDVPSPTEPRAAARDEAPSDGEWEDDDAGDITIDLNEPKSSSGNYWKSQFTKYHDDAREEMAKLVKHKHLAKLYAQQKDAENTQLLDRVKDLERQLQLKDNELQLAQSQGPWGGSGSARSSSPIRASREAEREIARLNREVEMLRKDNDSLRRENEALKATSSPERVRAPRPSAPAAAERAAAAVRSSAPLTADRAAAARERIAQRRRERLAAQAAQAA